MNTVFSHWRERNRKLSDNEIADDSSPHSPNDNGSEDTTEGRLNGFIDSN